LALQKDFEVVVSMVVLLVELLDTHTIELKDKQLGDNSDVQKAAKTAASLAFVWVEM
jgi:diacylglycerol kinase